MTTDVRKKMDVGGNLAEYLKLYYKRLFPFKQYIKWMSYGKRPFLPLLYSILLDYSVADPGGGRLGDRPPHSPQQTDPLIGR